MLTPGGPIKLALTSYVENHLTTILKAGSTEDFNTAFDDFFSEELEEITFNRKKLSRDAYKKQLGEAARADNTVSFPGIVGVPLASEDAIETGFVGTFVSASFPFVVTHGEPVLRTLNASGSEWIRGKLPSRVAPSILYLCCYQWPQRPSRNGIFVEKRRRLG